MKSESLLYRTGESTALRKALLISAAFPPSAEVGAARWEGFAPFMIAAGWGLDVIMEHPDTLAILDWERQNRLPAGIQVRGVPRTAPRWFQAMLSARRLARSAIGRGAPSDFALTSSVVESDSGYRRHPTMRERIIEHAHTVRDRAWIEKVARTASEAITRSHRVVISSGPPHDAHLAAYTVAKGAGLPHVVDLRDPWINPGGASNPGPHVGDQVDRYESQTLRASALVITNTVEMAASLCSRYPELATRVVAIPNGSDLIPQPPPPQQQGEKFIVAHTGSLYLDRDPRALLRAVARLYKAGAIDANTFRLVFMGDRTMVAGRCLEDWALEYGIAPVFEMRPRGTRAAARELLQSATVAVAFQGQTVTQIPAKVFEYVAFPVWLLALVGEDSATGQLLQGTSASVLAIDDEAGIADVLSVCIHEFYKSGRPIPVGADGRFSREAQASRLLLCLDRLATPD